jgi:HD-GYP domain-containing protein (c-di-GMP phosphodiesterase class II)
LTAITLHYPVQTLDERVLFPAGTVLSAKTLETLISSERKASRQIVSLLQYGTVREDLLKLFRQPPHNTIFDSQERVAEVLDLMEAIQLIVPVLQSLHYFKKNDFNTYRHILMVSSLATLLVKDLVPDHAERIRETATGPTHDFGKICVPLNILKKSSPLTRTEREIVEHHAAAGYVLLIHYLQDTEHIAARVSRDHHERKDGSGYPRGIRLADKMVEIVEVSDVYDALISPRPYRPKAFDNRTAIEEITRLAERNEIGWEPVKALVARNRRNKPHHSECSVALTKRGTPPAGNLYGLIAEEEGDKKDP